MQELIVCLIGLVIAIVTAAGYRSKLNESKELLGNLYDVAKESTDLIAAIREAVDDDKVTEEEVKRIIKEGNEVVEEGKQLIAFLRDYFGFPYKQK